MVMVEGVRCISFYAPPTSTSREDMGKIWEELVQKERIQDGRWIALGDLNWAADKAESNKAGIWMARAGGLQHRVNQGT